MNIRARLLRSLLLLGVTTPAFAAPELKPELIKLIKHDTSPTLREMGPIPLAYNKFTEVPNQPRPLKILKKVDTNRAQTPDPVVQTSAAPTLDIPTTASFDGVSSVNFVLPPDPTGEVGPNHYFQWVNLSFAIYSKTGSLLFGPASGNSLWQGFGGPCQTTNSGDPVVQYDHLADRWMVSQFGIPGSGGYYQCIAVSTTGDPTGSYYRYAFLVSSNKLNDYPKLGVWPDAYYMTANQFLNGISYAGAGVWAFERQKMLLGQPAQLVYFDLQAANPNFGGMLPVDLDGPAPPVGTPAYFAEADDSTFGFPTDQIAIWEFKVNWTTPALSTFGLSGQPNQIFTPTTGLAPFDMNLCPGNRNCIPQSGTTRRLDSIGDRLMYRLQYRNMGSYQVMVANHSVDVNGADFAGVRWYEFRKTGTAPWTIFQQSTFSPTTALNRWMASIAMDGSGNIGMGYTTSSSTTFPSLALAGRLKTDPLNTLRGDFPIFAGNGSQTSSSSRWGDYTHMSIDPVDNCTFWYTSEYYSSTSSANWRTRIVAVKVPTCTGTP